MSTVPTITANLVFPDVTHGQDAFNAEMNIYHQQTILMVDEMVDGVIPGINTVAGEVDANKVLANTSATNAALS